MTAVTERAVRTVTGQPGSPPVLMKDPDAAHQIALLLTSQAAVAGHIAVSCACLPREPGRGRTRRLIAARKIFPAPEAVAAWRAWHAEQGIEL